MNKRVPCRKDPCVTCPYRRDVPSGVWDASEYRKLLRFDGFALGIFHCHSTPEKACRGWVDVHADNIAVRVAMHEKALDPDEVFDSSSVPVFSSGAEAAAHGMRDIDDPSDEAMAAIDKVLELQRRRRDEAAT